VLLTSFSVKGFRSLQRLDGIPVSKPTILAGPNDSGKSAILAALSYLVGQYRLEDDDRTYLPSSDSPSRCETIEIEGEFTLDEWEQKKFGLGATVRLRRSANADSVSRLECWLPVPHDERLRDLSSHNVSELRKLAKELGVSFSGTRRADIEQALREYAALHSGPEGWMPAPSDLASRMPTVLPFDGQSSEPNDVVRSVLQSCFQNHLADETLQEQLSEIETQVKERLQADAKSLCDHILSRCPDIKEVFVEPQVAFSQGLKAAPLRIARSSGEHVGLERSGQGSARRISLAIWEWTSDSLQAEQDVAAEPSDVGDEPTPTRPQVIVVYDEPDTHLDYIHQRKIMRLIREQSALAHVGVMVATHSMNLIDGVNIADVINLKLDGSGRTVMERLGTDEHGAIDRHLQDLAASLGLRNSVLLNERVFLAVEGPSEQQAIPLLFRLAEGLSLQAAGIALWACNNNEGALHMASYLIEHQRSVMLMIDADSKNLTIFKPDRLEKRFGRNYRDFVKFLGEPQAVNEFEELFDDEVWAQVANTIWPKPSGQWNAEEFKALRGDGKFSSKVQDLLQRGSNTGPRGKPEMMYQLASSLTSPEQVPMQLREAFAELRQLAE
jgi:putative ATP-dependent endonuclease of OLD family